MHIVFIPRTYRRRRRLPADDQLGRPGADGRIQPRSTPSPINACAASHSGVEASPMTALRPRTSSTVTPGDRHVPPLAIQLSSSGCSRSTAFVNRASGVARADLDEVVHEHELAGVAHVDRLVGVLGQQRHHHREVPGVLRVVLPAFGGGARRSSSGADCAGPAAVRRTRGPVLAEQERGAHLLSATLSRASRARWVRWPRPARRRAAGCCCSSGTGSAGRTGPSTGSAAAGSPRTPPAAGSRRSRRPR